MTHTTATLPLRQNTKRMVQRDSSEPYFSCRTQHVDPCMKTHLLPSSVSPPAVCTSETGSLGVSTSLFNHGGDTFPSYMTPEKRTEKDCKTIKRRCIEQFMSPFAFAKYVADQLPAGCYELPKLQHSLSKGEYRVRFILDGKRRERSFSTKVRGNAYALNAASLLVRLIQSRCKNEKKDDIYDTVESSNPTKPMVVDKEDFPKSPQFIPTNESVPAKGVAPPCTTVDNHDIVTGPTLKKCKASQENLSFKEIVMNERNNAVQNDKALNIGSKTTQDSGFLLPCLSEAYFFQAAKTEPPSNSLFIHKPIKNQTKTCAPSPQLRPTPCMGTPAHDKIPTACETMFHAHANEQLDTLLFHSVRSGHDPSNNFCDTSDMTKFVSSNQPGVTNTDTGISKELHELFLKYHEKIKMLVSTFNKSLSFTQTTFSEKEFIQECCYELIQVLLTLEHYKERLGFNCSASPKSHTWAVVEKTMSTLSSQKDSCTGHSRTSPLHEYNPFKRIPCVLTLSNNVSIVHEKFSTPTKKNLTPEQINILEQVSVNALGPTKKKKNGSNRRPSITFQSEGPSWTISTPYYDYYSRRTSTCQHIVPLTDLSVDTVSETFMSSLMYLLQTFKYSIITAQCLNKSGGWSNYK